MKSDCDSSLTPPLNADATVYQNGIPTGPIQLPEKESEAFKAQFNATYAGKNLRLS